MLKPPREHDADYYRRNALDLVDDLATPVGRPVKQQHKDWDARSSHWYPLFLAACGVAIAVAAVLVGLWLWLQHV